MTTKEFLQRFIVIQRQVDNSLSQMMELQSMAKRITSVIRNTPIGSMQSVSRVENSVVDIHDMTEQLAQALSCAVAVRQEIAEAISRVPNDDERCLLSMRYICCDSWETIAKKMHFSLQGVFKLHRRALKNFQIS